MWYPVNSLQLPADILSTIPSKSRSKSTDSGWRITVPTGGWTYDTRAICRHHRGSWFIQPTTSYCSTIDQPMQSWWISTSQMKSNQPDLLSQVNSEPPITQHSFELSDAKVLGLLWMPTTNTFKFYIELESYVTLTKRNILSDIARIFDPLGLISPVVIQAKIILQNLWLEKLHWDDPLSAQLCEKWSPFQRGLSELQHLTIPRWLRLDPEVLSVQIHGFSDASRLAFSAVVYLRIVHPQSTSAQFICSKTKFAPLKPCTIPRHF